MVDLVRRRVDSVGIWEDCDDVAIGKWWVSDPGKAKGSAKAKGHTKESSSPPKN